MDQDLSSLLCNYGSKLVNTKCAKFTEGIIHMTWVLLVFLFDFTHTYPNSAYWDQKTDTHVSIYLHHLLCAHSS